MSVDGINRRSDSLPVQFQADLTPPSNGKTPKVSPERSQDQVELSEKSREFLRIRQLVDAQPDFRLDRVNQLAKAIDEGTYNVKGEQIADAIIRKNLIDLQA